ncbi:hypothetical protein [Bergeyella zoohelcum]|uniref:Uncharacterized protein n=1 Tax=Bergeyella zoohelcum TaxID=1015 RepID=A0A7Z8YQ59_9FLAO|nr:hypothetical protein [Bergeyella zoohelcum]VDH04621.1 Uncharacterised protein [Bergeyella zoohelcum]
MLIKTKLLFILIGNDKTGKTILQKKLLEKLTGEARERLDTNLGFDIKHSEIKRKYQNVSFGNRSYQEKKKSYGNKVSQYFEKYFKDCDISFISSHLIKNDIEEMIEEGKKRFFNVNAIFFSNSIELNKDDNSDISSLNWDEKFIIHNPNVDKQQLDKQLDRIAESIVDLLINRTKIS